jgi:hypothetical protein
MKLILLKPNSPEWDFAWNWLASHPINEAIEDPSTALNEGEAWQYMGSYWNGSDKLISEFRHRNHIRTQDVTRLSVEHKEFNPESFEKIINL